MAKIEIKGSPEELERVSTFLINNNIKFSLIKDFGNHSLEDSDRFNSLIQKFK
jgi:hypothetical protein|tara:strand:+ start:1011 stop:1169 length:159 start_codon:yes stop_codon:yes gene_type:complete